MNDLQIFKNEEFGEIRTLEINNEPWFVAKDICEILDIKNTTQAINRLEDDEHTMLNIGRQGNTNFINEYGLYNLILASRKKEAREFKRWITHEVLPSIRKHGGYLTESKIEEALLNPDTIIQLATALKNEKIEKEKLMSENKNLIVENEKQNQLIGELKPKADYTDRILRSRGTVKVNVIANDYGFTATAFNKKIKELGIQYKEGKNWLLYKKYREKGYTHTKTFEFKHSDGTPDTKTNMEWTQKGRLFLYEILKQHGILPMIEQEVLFN